MLFKIEKLKFNDDNTIDIPDGYIPLSHMVEPINGLLDIVEHHDHGWKTFLIVLVPVKSQGKIE